MQIDLSLGENVCIEEVVRKELLGQMKYYHVNRDDFDKHYKSATLELRRQKP